MVTVHWFNGSGTCERLHFMIDKFCDSRYMKIFKGVTNLTQIE